MLFAVALLAAGTPGACAITRPAACRDTNALAISPGFRAAIARFFAPSRSRLSAVNRTVAGEAVDVLHGPPDAPRKIGPNYLFTACEAHACPEKGALALTPSGQILAIGVLHSPCSLPDPGKQCWNRNLLTIFVRGRHPEIDAAIRQWAAAETRNNVEHSETVAV